MFKKIFKKKIIYCLFKLINYKKKKINILGPYGNYSFNLIITKINKKFFFFPVLSIKKIKINKKFLIPIENNNGGLVNDSINLLNNNSIFFNSIIILNINHKFFLYKKKKKIFLHNQSFKQTNFNLKKFFFNFKIKKNESNSLINNGINISNNSIKKILIFNIKNIFLKNNIINKTKFFFLNSLSKKKQIITFFTNTNFIFLYKILSKIINLYTNKKKNYIEVYLKSFKKLIFYMKYFKNKINISFKGFYSIL